MSDIDSKVIKCLDHGFVRLVDVMGDDLAVVQAARISVAGEGVRKVSEDRGLIRYLMRMRHTTPFEMVEFKFHIKLPIFVERQMIRHRMANTNEMSARYSELPECYYVPEAGNIQYQATTNKQGRAGVMEDADTYRPFFQAEAADAFAMYKKRLDADMARELARINLPLSTYTEKYWKMDLKNLLDFLTLRMDKHAQYEIRVFAEAIAVFVKDRCPLIWEAFEDYRLGSMSFSAVELRELKRILKTSAADGASEAWTAGIDGDWPTSREREEFMAKIKSLIGL